ncbi:hypothetical protein KK083_01270 [Fulvivirgaceae bacterium PWU4]|uniref:Stf0 sulfotransferase n=1 Tax=Chryseosolibacter histidini TaxID=2782349 RepID=A0AAP2DG17_9BACT|nr:hypothetical protein [Chryseosolibacter histidini]MBT1695486.1 hypothetical protein [Chryseosolibacter histidini]
MSYNKFVVICTARTGSVYLSTKLHSHSNILCYLEMFDGKEKDLDFFAGDLISGLPVSLQEAKKMRNEKPDEFLQKIIFRDYPENIKAVGFKFHYPHAKDYPSVLNKIIDDRSIRILHLKRPNILDSLVSLKKAMLTRKWINHPHHEDTVSEDAKVTLDYENCRAYFNEIEEEWSRFDRYFRHHQVLNLDYDEVTADKTDEAIMDFLEVPRCEIKSRLRKHPVVKHSVAVQNYYELKEKFRDTQWSAFFASE